MYSIKRTDEFADWLDGLKDRMTRVRLNRRLDRALLGSLGDVKPVGAGWRMYYVQRGEVLIVMIGGGEKSTQTGDIARAIKFASTMED
jgi:putative addiction module killer protein